MCNFFRGAFFRVKAIILAAGKGTRLRPYTDTMPKCLTPIGGHPILVRQVECLQRFGILDITIVAGYKHEQIKIPGVKKVVNHEFDKTNMVSSLFCAVNEFSGSDVIVVYGDIVFEPYVLAALINSQNPISVVVDWNWRPYWQARMSDPLEDAETLKLGPKSELLEIGKKAASYDDIQAQYIGLIKFREDYLLGITEIYRELIRLGQLNSEPAEKMYMTTFLQHLINIDWTLTAVPIRNGWLELDTVDDLRLYERLLETNSLGRFCDLSIVD